MRSIHAILCPVKTSKYGVSGTSIRVELRKNTAYKVRSNQDIYLRMFAEDSGAATVDDYLVSSGEKEDIQTMNNHRYLAIIAGGSGTVWITEAEE
jgi:hypothetical protein